MGYRGFAVERIRVYGVDLLEREGEARERRERFGAIRTRLREGTLVLVFVFVFVFAGFLSVDIVLCLLRLLLESNRCWCCFPF